MTEEQAKKEAQRKELFRGIALMFASLPFIFSGPALLFAVGVPQLREGNIYILLLSLLMMLIAGLLGITGLRVVLRAFFDRN
jgi:hypothetical protein